MPRAKTKVIRPLLSKAPTEFKDWMKLRARLPKGRVTLVCGSAGSGKSLLAMEFLVHGAVRYGEPGVCMDFEETEEKLTANVASLGFDLRALAKSQEIAGGTTFPLSATKLPTRESTPRRPFHPFGPRRQYDQSKTRRPGQHRGTFCRIKRLNDAAGRTTGYSSGWKTTSLRPLLPAKRESTR